MKDTEHRYIFHTGIGFFVGARLDKIRNVEFVIVIFVQCGKSSQEKWLKCSMNAYLANTKGFPKTKCWSCFGTRVSLFRAGVPDGTPPLGKIRTLQQNCHKFEPTMHL